MSVRPACLTWIRKPLSCVGASKWLNMGCCEIGIRFVFQCRIVGAHVKLDGISKHIDTNGFDFLDMKVLLHL